MSLLSSQSRFFKLLSDLLCATCVRKIHVSPDYDNLMLSIPYITWSTAAAIIALICYCGVPLVCQVYSISACVLSRIHLPSPPGYVDPMMPCNLCFSPYPLFVCIVLIHVTYPSCPLSRSQLRFLRSTIFPTLNALMFVLMTNCISRNRDA